jgi:hypothetical protein
MKNRAIIEAGFGQLNEILDMVGSQIGKKLNLDIAKLGLNDGPRVMDVHRFTSCRGGLNSQAISGHPNRDKPTHHTYNP